MTKLKDVGFASLFIGKVRELTAYDRDLVNSLLNLEIMLKAILNRGINFNDNIDCRVIDFTSSGTPNAENTIAHDLGKIPTGYFVVGKDKAGDLYNGTTTWTATNIYLKNAVASVTAKIIIF